MNQSARADNRRNTVTQLSTSKWHRLAYRVTRSAFSRNNNGENDMSVEDNKRIVREFCNHFKTSNADGLIDGMTEDATWWVNGKPHLFPSAGTKTKTEAASMFRNMFTAYSNGLDMKVINLIGEGDSIAAEARSQATTKSGKIYENEYFILFKIRDGKIASVREYTDLMHVQETFG
ncbi:nuclear transport factor 2 family protein [Rhizobium laguerreae]|uniref:nuclear transport factor 2 family protein n=5 Tax=Rhizobium laguerreae TaxID=1076926 RepID=UPI00103CBB8D|nr:nuclear transport factor 2 family protein [Rhizobium laguerreae]TBY08224.1 nuclear transport factor 2 family protein [Rhizobium laguerreae]